MSKLDALSGLQLMQDGHTAAHSHVHGNTNSSLNLGTEAKSKSCLAERCREQVSLGAKSRE